MNDESELSMQIAASQGANFTALLLRNDEQIGNIGNQDQIFQIRLQNEPTLAEMLAIITFAENLNPIFKSHRFEYRVVNKRAVV